MENKDNMIKISENKYSITYDPENALLVFSGALLLNSATEYEPILQLLKDSADSQEPNKLDIDLYNLSFMNSSGLNMITKFIMYFNEVKRYKLQLSIIINKNIIWQEKLCANMKKLLSSLNIKRR